MIRTNVESSNIKSIGHSDKEKLLEIEFKSGGVYRYEKVEESTFKGIMEAESKGKFFHANIKGRYNFHKIDKAQDLAGQRIKDITIKDADQVEIIYKDTLEKALERWIEVYQADKEDKSKYAERNAIVVFIKYLLSK